MRFMVPFKLLTDLLCKILIVESKFLIRSLVIYVSI